MLNEPAVASTSDPLDAFDRFVEEWRNQGIVIGHLRHKAEQRPEFVFELLGQRNVLAEVAEFRNQRAEFPTIEIHFFNWREYGDVVRTHPEHLRPDLLQVPTTWCSSLAGKFKILAPIADRIDEKLHAEYEPALMEPCLVYGAPPLYGLPWLVDVRLLYFWRADLPTLEDELRKSNNAREAFWQSLRLAERHSSDPLFAIPTASEWELMHHLALLVWGQGGQFIETHAGLRRYNIPVFQEAALRGATYLRNLLQQGLIQLPEIKRQDLEQRFLDHRVSSIITGPWLIQQIQQRYKDQKWDRLVGVSLPPFYESPDTAVTFLGGTMLSITGRLPAMKDFALELAKHLSQAQATLQWTQAEGLIPAAKSLRGSAGGTDDGSTNAAGACNTYYQCLAKNSANLEAAKVVDKAIRVGRGYPAIPQWWDLEIPGSLGPIYHFWHQLATLQLEDGLRADLARLDEDWRRVLDEPQPTLSQPVIAGILSAALILVLGGWAVAHRWLRKPEEQVGHPLEDVVDRTNTDETTSSRIQISSGAALGQELRKTREQVGHSRRDVEDRTDIDVKTIRRIENGEVPNPHPRTMQRLRAYIKNPNQDWSEEPRKRS